MNDKRPKHLALHQIRLPLPGIVSILHRVSGLLLFFAVPWLLLMFQYSLRSIETYTQLMEVLANPLIKGLLAGLIWACLHHFFAGLRLLAIDLDYGVKLAQARASSKMVLAASLILTVFLGARLW
jgi:succinate dehydrogenase / fumarate reductase cytochrome b subunit